MMVMPVIVMIMTIMPMIVVVVMIVTVLMVMDALGRTAAARVLAEQQRLDRDRHGV